MQGSLERLEGISLLGVDVDSAMFKAFNGTPMLRILILDGVKAKSMHFGYRAPRLAMLLCQAGFKGHKVLSGFQLPRIAMMSWRNADGRALPLAFGTIKSAAVLDISESAQLKRLPADLQARPLLFLVWCRCSATREMFFLISYVPQDVLDVIGVAFCLVGSTTEL